MTLRVLNSLHIDNINYIIARNSKESVFSGQEEICYPTITYLVIQGYEGQGESKETRSEAIGTAIVSLAEWARGCQPPNKEVQEVIVEESILQQQITQVPITLSNGSRTYNATLVVSTVLLFTLLCKLIVIVVIIMMFV